MTDTASKIETARDALRQVPDLVEHIVAMIGVKAKPGPDDEVRSKRVHAPLPFNEGAFNDANELYGRLTHWANHWGKELGAPAPGPARRAARSSWTVVGLPVGTEPQQARYDTGIMATWLLIHLDEICRHAPDDVAYFLTELNEIHQAAARYPVNLQPRFTDIRCRVVGCAGTVALWPFTEVKHWTENGANVYLPPEGARVLCDECSDRWTETEYTDEVDRRVLAAKEQRKADNVARRLAKKYADPTQYPLFLGTVAGKVRHVEPK